MPVESPQMNSNWKVWNMLWRQSPSKVDHTRPTEELDLLDLLTQTIQTAGPILVNIISLFLHSVIYAFFSELLWKEFWITDSPLANFLLKLLNQTSMITNFTPLSKKSQPYPKIIKGGWLSAGLLKRRAHIIYFKYIISTRACSKIFKYLAFNFF